MKISIIFVVVMRLYSEPIAPKKLVGTLGFVLRSQRAREASECCEAKLLDSPTLAFLDFLVFFLFAMFFAFLVCVCVSISHLGN